MPEPLTLARPHEHGRQQYAPTRETHAFARLSLAALCERLTLLAHMRLPCVLFVANPEDEATGHCFRGSIRHCERENGQVFIQGDGFELRLKEQGIDQIHLTERWREDGRTHTSVELRRPDGKLIARIGGAPEPVVGAVWQDLMDSFTVSTL
ncbi:MAG TPA: hypothetical protein VNL74_07925 [Methylococcus sp.]|nr:hypothetical protein [Methylococcus sp.]